jgi:hypothetical protein
VMPTFEAYIASLSGLSEHSDPTMATEVSEEIREAAASLSAIPEIDINRWQSGQRTILLGSRYLGSRWGCHRSG